MSKPTFEHRHFKVIAAIIASLPYLERADTAKLFADKLGATNPRFDRARFLAAASGTPCNGRDKVQA